MLAKSFMGCAFCFPANCYNASDNGHGYQGNISTTSDGTPCQAWGSDSPDLAENYCRNPAQVGMRPWCFTDVEGGVWGYCDISECSAIGKYEVLNCFGIHIL